MTGFDSRAGSHRVETPTTNAPTTTAQAAPELTGEAAVKQKLNAMDGIVYVEATAGSHVVVAIDTRHVGTGHLRAAGLMIDTEAEILGHRVALEEAMQTDDSAFNYSASPDAVHIETGIISIR